MTNTQQWLSVLPVLSEGACSKDISLSYAYMQSMHLMYNVHLQLTSYSITLKECLLIHLAKVNVHM